MSGTSYGVMALLMWSTTAVMVAWLAAIPALQIVSLTFFTGFVVLSATQIVKKENPLNYWRRPPADYIFWLCGPGLYTIILYLAFKLAPPFEANILNYLWPILLVIFASLLHDVSLNFSRIAGILAGFAGLVVVMIPPAGHDFFADFKWGHTLALLSATLWALYSAQRRKKDYPMGFLAPVFLVFSAISFVLHLIFETTVKPGLFETSLIVLLGLTRVSYMFWDYAMKHGDVVLLTSLSYFLPLASTVFLIIFGIGPERPMIAAGAGLIIAGCVLVNGDKIMGALKSKSKNN